MLHETSQQEADRMLMEYRANRPFSYRIAESTEMHETGMTMHCASCDLLRYTEKAYCPDCCEVTGSYTIHAKELEA